MVGEKNSNIFRVSFHLDLNSFRFHLDLIVFFFTKSNNI